MKLSKMVQWLPRTGDEMLLLGGNDKPLTKWRVAEVIDHSLKANSKSFTVRIELVMQPDD